MPRIVKRPAAKRDLTLTFVWFADHAGIEVARRFLRAADKAFQDLAEMPRIGPLKVHEGKLAGARTWRVPGFESYLVFYRP